MKLKHYLFGEVLEGAPFLSWMHGFPACTRFLASKLGVTYLENKDTLFHCGQRNDVVHVLRLGRVWISQNDRVHERHAQPQDEGGEERQGAKKSAFRRKRPKGEFLRRTDAHELGIFRAADALRKEDLRVVFSVRLIQRFWRRRAAPLLEAEAAAKGSPLHHNGRSKSFAFAHTRAKYLTSNLVIESTVVPAPAYFGESCLWVPRARWASHTVRYKYTVTCMSRCDVLQVSRAAIEETVERFSPWLGQRLDFFQEAVLGQHKDCDAALVRGAVKAFGAAGVGGGGPPSHACSEAKELAGMPDPSDLVGLSVNNLPSRMAAAI